MENSSIRRRSHPGSWKTDQAGSVQEEKSVEKSTPVLEEDRKSVLHKLLVATTVFLFILAIISLTRRWAPEILFRATKSSDTRITKLLGERLDIPLSPQNHLSRKQRTLEFDWNITADYKRPDGVKKRIFLINGEFPGPTIEAQGGDTIRLLVRNLLEKEEDIGIHFHGLHMRDANDMDGAVGLTQCGIRPNEDFTYEFNISEEQHGTFWYHAHDQVQRADGFFGAFVVHPAKGSTAMDLANVFPAYDEERVLLVGDWYHRSSEEVLKWYMRAGSFGNEPVPDSVIVNGKGTFNCSDAVPARPIDCRKMRPEEKPYIELDQWKKYRFRIVNTGTLAGFTLSVRGASLTLIAVDGGHASATNELVQSIGILHPGERMDVILEMSSSDSDATSLVITLDEENFRYPNPSLTLNHSFPLVFNTVSEAIKKTSKSLYGSSLSLDTVTQPNQSNKPLFPAEADLTFVVYATTLKLSRLSNIPHGFMNHTSWKPQLEPPLPLLLIPRKRWDENQFVPRVPLSAKDALWVDLVINNLDDGSHPFHLHGYDFYVLSIHPGGSSYWGSFNPFDAPDGPPGGPFNLVNPIKKDTVFVPRRGYTVIRFLADNEGIWMFHCHILWHQASGMSMAFQISTGNSSGSTPASNLKLSNVEQLHKSCEI